MALTDFTTLPAAGGDGAGETAAAALRERQALAHEMARLAEELVDQVAALRATGGRAGDAEGEAAGAPGGDDVAALQAEVERLEAECARQKVATSVLREEQRQRQVLSAQNANLLGGHAQLRQDVKQARADVERWQREADAQRRAAEDARVQSRTLARKLEEEERISRERQAEVVALRRALGEQTAAAKLASGASEELRIELGSVRADLERVSELRNKQREKLNATLVEVSDLRRQVDTLKLQHQRSLLAAEDLRTTLHKTRKAKHNASVLSASRASAIRPGKSTDLDRELFQLTTLGVQLSKGGDETGSHAALSSASLGASDWSTISHATPKRASAPVAQSPAPALGAVVPAGSASPIAQSPAPAARAAAADAPLIEVDEVIVRESSIEFLASPQKAPDGGADDACDTSFDLVSDLTDDSRDAVSVDDLLQ